MSLNTRCSSCIPCLKKKKRSNCHFKPTVKQWTPRSSNKTILNNLHEDYKAQESQITEYDKNCDDGKSQEQCKKYIRKLTRIMDARNHWMNEYLDPRCHTCDYNKKNHLGRINAYKSQIRDLTQKMKMLSLSPSPKTHTIKKPSPTNKTRKTSPKISVNMYKEFSSPPESKKSPKTAKTRKSPVKTSPKTRAKTPISKLKKQTKKLEKTLREIDILELKTQNKTLNSAQTRKLATKVDVQNQIHRLNMLIIEKENKEAALKILKENKEAALKILKEKKEAKTRKRYSTNAE